MAKLLQAGTSRLAVIYEFDDDARDSVTFERLKEVVTRWCDLDNPFAHLDPALGPVPDADIRDMPRAGSLHFECGIYATMDDALRVAHKMGAIVPVTMGQAVQLDRERRLGRDYAAKHPYPADNAPITSAMWNEWMQKGDEL